MPCLHWFVKFENKRMRCFSSAYLRYNLLVIWILYYMTFIITTIASGHYVPIILASEESWFTSGKFMGIGNNLGRKIIGNITLMNVLSAVLLWGWGALSESFIWVSTNHFSHKNQNICLLLKDIECITIPPVHLLN